MYHDTAKCHNTIHLEGVNEQNIHAVINNSSVQYEQPMAVQVTVFFPRYHKLYNLLHQNGCSAHR